MISGGEGWGREQTPGAIAILVAQGVGEGEGGEAFWWASCCCTQAWNWSGGTALTRICIE
jgi:hypothetical protein